jgi:hypothetical protein
MKLKKLVKESWLDEPKQLSKEERTAFLEEVGKYGSYGKSIYSEGNLMEIAQQLSKIVEQAEVVALTEAGEDFDSLTIERNMKHVKGLCKEFAKTATETQHLRSRLQSLYEDMGNILGRYYDIKDESVEDMLNVDGGKGTKPYDGTNAVTPVKEVTDQQRVDNNMGLKPYDAWKSEENESQPMKKS